MIATNVFSTLFCVKENGGDYWKMGITAEFHIARNVFTLYYRCTNTILLFHFIEDMTDVSFWVNAKVLTNHTNLYHPAYQGERVEPLPKLC